MVESGGRVLERAICHRVRRRRHRARLAPCLFRHAATWTPLTLTCFPRAATRLTSLAYAYLLLSSTHRQHT